MAISSRDFKLQFTATSNYGTRETPVELLLANGDVKQISQVIWNPDTETVRIVEVVETVVNPPETEPNPEG